jgi:hypothetical protein
MRMARAFIASVPLAVVLVAAVVVPVAVSPGTFGFEGWPISRSEPVAERRVEEPPRLVSVRTDGSQRNAVASSRRRTVVAARRPVAPAATSLPTARPRRRTAHLVVTHPGRAGRESSGPAPAAPAPGSPASSAPEPEAQPGPEMSQLAAGEEPVLRDDDPAPPSPPASPVQPAAPVVPSPAAPDCDRHEHRDRGNRHGHGLGRHDR